MIKYERFKKLKQIRHCNIIPSDLPKLVFLDQTKMVFGEKKLFPNGNGALDAMEQFPQATNAQKLQNHKTFQNFSNTVLRPGNSQETTARDSPQSMFLTSP